MVGREEEGLGAPVVVGPAGEEDAAGSRSRRVQPVSEIAFDPRLSAMRTPPLRMAEKAGAWMPQPYGYKPFRFISEG